MKRSALVLHWRRDWKAIVFVIALFQIIEFTETLDFVEAIDGHAFVLMFQLTKPSSLIQSTLESKPELSAPPRPESEPDAVVVSIDDATFKGEYAGRSPLDRCVLHEQLERIYSRRPRAVVVDLDLSPVPPSTRLEKFPARPAECQDDLDRLIRDNRHRTVLVEPFDAAEARKWQNSMEKEGVRFASPAIPVQFGLAVRGHVDEGSLVRVAAAVARASAPRGKDPVRIDPRLYAKGLKIAPIQYLPQSLPKSLEGSVVFFGAAYGAEGDLFLTPIGDVYGVELHAATFQSRHDPTRMHLERIVKLALDLVLGVVFGFVSWSCWRQYFSAVGSKGPLRQVAGVWVILLVVLYAVVVSVSLWGAAALLAGCGVWLSPVPIAVGMFIDGFVSGAPGAADPEV